MQRKLAKGSLRLLMRLTKRMRGHAPTPRGKGSRRHPLVRHPSAGVDGAEVGAVSSRFKKVTESLGCPRRLKCQHGRLYLRG